MNDMHFAKHNPRGNVKKRYFVSLFSGLALLAFAQVSAHKEKEIIVVQEPVQPVVVAEPAVLVESAPPADVQETIPPAPGPGFHYIKGCWKWNGQWAWTPGYWVAVPHPGAVWVPGYWVKHHHRHGWYWVDGHWK